MSDARSKDLRYIVDLYENTCIGGEQEYVCAEDDGIIESKNDSRDIARGKLMTGIDIECRGIERLRKMQISQYEGRMLTVLASMIRPKSILEIGTLFGYSAMCMALSLDTMQNGLRSTDDDCDIAPFENQHEQQRVITIEQNAEHVKIARENIERNGMSDLITVVEGKALNVLPNLVDTYKFDRNPIDLIFIDGKKSEYCEYLSFAEQYLRCGGMIIADNTLLFGAMSDDVSEDPKLAEMKNVMQRFNEKIAKCFDSFIIPTREGLTVAIKR